MSAGLSHVIFVIDFGSSCSHALFAKRPVVDAWIRPEEHFEALSGG
jgi:hypothetical protein